MPDPAAPYKIIGVAPGRVITGRRCGSPPESWLLNWAKQRHCSIVIRYFPSRKGWRLLDLRNAQCFIVGNGRTFQKWTGQIRGKRYWPTEESAVMVAMHTLGCVPETD